MNGAVSIDLKCVLHLAMSDHLSCEVKCVHLRNMG